MEKNNIIIIDNFLDDQEFKDLSSFVLSQKFPWFFGEYVSVDPKDRELINDPLAVETSGFHHIVFDKEMSIKSFTFSAAEPFFNRLHEKFGYELQHLIRARYGMKFQKSDYTSDNYNIPHVDYFFPHHTIIFYLNDSDGDTRLFEQQYVLIKNGEGIGQTQFNTQARITPKANRLLLFDGLQYHTASNPILSHRRIVFNINLYPL